MMYRLASAAFLLASLNAASALTCSKTRTASSITGQASSALNTNAAIAAASSAATPAQLTWGCLVEPADGVNTYVSWTVSDLSYSATSASYFQVFTMWGYPCFQGLLPSISEPFGWVFKKSGTANCTTGGKYNLTHSAPGVYNIVSCTDAVLNGVPDGNGGMTNCFKTNSTLGVWINGNCSNGTLVGSTCPYGGFVGATYYSSNTSACINGLVDGTTTPCATTGATSVPCTNGTTDIGSYTKATQYGNPSFLYQAMGTPAWYDMNLASPSNPNAWCRSDKKAGKCSSNGFIQVPSSGSPTCIMVICLNTVWESNALTAAGSVLPATAPSCSVSMSIAVGASLADTLVASSAAGFFQFTSMLVGVFLALLIQ